MSNRIKSLSLSRHYLGPNDSRNFTLKGGSDEYFMCVCVCVCVCISVCVCDLITYTLCSFSPSEASVLVKLSLVQDT